MEWMTPGPEPIKAKPVPTQGPQGAQGVQGAPVAPAPKPQQGAQGPQGVTRQPTGAQGAQGQVQAQYEHNLLTPQGVQDAVNKGQITLTTDQLAAYREDKWQALPGSPDRVQQTYVAPSWKDGKYQGGYYTSEYVEPGKALVLLKRGNVWLTTDEQEAAKAQIAHLNKEYHDYKQSYAIGTVLQKSPELKHYPGILSAMMQGTTITSKNVKTYGAIGAVFDKFPALAANPRVLGALMSGQNLTRELLLQNNIPAERVNMILEAQKTYRGFVVPEHEVAGILKAQSLYTMSLESMKNYGDYVDFLIKTEPHPGLLQELGHAVQSGIAAIPGGLAVENAVISAVGGILGLMNAHPLMWLDHLLHSEQNKISKEGGGTPLAATTPVLGVATTALDMVTGLFNSTQHFYRTYETIKNTRGEAAALEALMPSVLGAGVGMAVGAALTAIPGTEELAPGELAATGAGLDSSLAAADAAGAALDMSRFTKAVQELRDSANALKDLVKMPFESLSKTEAYQTFLRAKASVETLLRPFVDVVRPVTDVTGKVINKYSIAGWQIGADIGGQTMYRKEWAETADATKWAKDHPNEAPTLGQALLGRHNFASGAVDFLISVGAQDPYAVAGSFRKDIRSVEGLTFNLHLPFIDKTLNHVWSGTAFANVDQAYEQYAGVRRALNAIVANVDNVAAINRIDKRLAPIAPLLHAAKADTPEETLRNVMDVFKNLSAVDEVFTTGKLPMTSSMLLRLRQMEVGSKGRFTFMPMFLDFSGKVQDWGVRNRDFTLGDSGALPALAHGLEQIGIPRSVVDEAINHLASTKDPGEWMNTYKTVVKGHLQLQMVATLVGDKLAAEFDPVVLDSFLAHFDAQVNEAVDRAANLVTGFGGISTKEHAYAYGRDGMNLSHATDGVKEASAAVYESQVGRIHFPNYNEFQRSTHGLVRALKNSSSVKQLDVSLKKLLSEPEYEDFVNSVASGMVVPPTVGHSTPAMMREWAKAITEHDQAIADAEAKRAAAERKVIEGKADELDRRVAKNKYNREHPTFTGVSQLLTRLEQAHRRNKNIGIDDVFEAARFFDAIGPELFAGTRLSILAKTESGSAGQYDFVNNLFTLFKQGVESPEGINRTFIHESFHMLSQYVPREELNGFYRELDNARIDFIRQGNLQRMVEWAKKNGYLKATYAETMAATKRGFESDREMRDLQKLVEDHAAGEFGRNAHIPVDKVNWYKIPYIRAFDNYRLTNVDEWFAEGMYDRWAGYDQKRSPFMDLAHKIMAAIFAAIHRISGSQASEITFRKFMDQRFQVKQSVGAITDRVDQSIIDAVSSRKAPLTSDVAVEFREHRTDLGISKELSGKFVQNLRYAWDTTKGGSGVMKDFIDRYVNDNYFKPMALATGGWATRVSASEIMLNAMRQGPINLSLARFAAAGARHERAVLHWGKDLERKSIMDIAARVAYVLGGKFVDPNHRVFSSNEEMGHFVAVLHGVMAGVETSILKGLGKQEFMDAAIRSLYLNQGHLAPQMVEGGHAMVNDRSLPAKGSIMSVDTALSAEKDTAEGVRAMKAKMEQIVGHKARLSTSGEFTGIGSGNQGFIVSRLFQADTQATDKSVHYALQEMVRVFDEEIKAGKSVEQAWESAKVEGIGAHYEFMQSLPQSTREIMVRQKNFVPTNTEFLKKYPYATDDPGLAHSAVAIEGLESTLWGGRNLPATGKPYFDERLFKDMAARTIKDKSWQEFARAYHTGPDGERLGSEHFSMVFGPKVNHITFSELLPTHASEWLNTKFTSRIVSRLSREPIFIVEFAKQRKIAERELASKLGEAVDDEAATLMQDRSEAMAMARASMEMVRYIHNPYDKLKFEYGMRVIAPFYFAQNQSWRRMGRLLVEDPGAFERYAKLVMQTLNFSYAASKSTGGYPTITMPFSGSIMGFVTKMLDGGVAVPIGISLSLSSAQSILPISPLDTVEPTNALSSSASLVHSLIPRFGPVFNLPLKWILPSFGVLTPLELQKINDTIVGATGESTSLVQDAVPNSFIDHMLQTSIGVLGAVWSKPGQNINSQFLSSYITASDETWRYIIEKKFDQLEATVRAASKGKSDNYINNLVLQNFQQFYSPGTPEGKKHLSDLFSEVNKATATRAVVRAVVGFMSPLSTSMGQANQQFTQDYQNLVYLLNGDTMAAQDKLLSLNPDRAPYTIATTASKSQGLMAPGTSWPTTQNGLHWMEANTGIVSAYPSASRYLMPIATLESSKNPYDALAQLYQIQQQFREKRTPADMMTALNISVGNYFFNQVVLPTYENYFKSQGVSDPAYSAYAQGGKQWIQSTGSVLNPDWVAYHGAAEGKQFRTQTLNQVKNLIADPKYAKMPQMQNLRNVYDSYVALDAEMTQMNYTSSQKGAAWNGKGGVVDQMKKLVPSMVPFITDVLAPLYPYYPNG